MANINELQEKELKEVTGAAAGDDISCGNFSVKENGVYTNGTRYVFIISKSDLNNGNGIVNALHRNAQNDKFTTTAISNIESINLICNSYQFVCITTEEAFQSAKKPSDLQ